MTRTEPSNDGPTPGEPGPADRRAATAEALARDLLACGFGERILLLIDGDTGSDLDRELETRVAARKGTVRTLGLPDGPSGQSALAAALAQDLPDAIVNRSRHGIAAWPCVVDALTGGSRLLELPGLDDAALGRCLARIEGGSLRWEALATGRRIDRAMTLAVTGGGRTRSFTIATARGGGAGDFQPAPLMRGQVASLPGAVQAALADGSTLLIGLNPSARPDASPLERSRSRGTVTVIGADGRTTESIADATILVDGAPLEPDGPIPPPATRGRRRGPVARAIESATRVLSRKPLRIFDPGESAGAGRLVLAGSLAAQSVWLRGLTGRSVGRLVSTGTFRAGGLRRRLRPDDVVVAILGGPRSRLERLGDREEGWLEVPTYARMVVPLGPLREKGLEAFAAASESAKEPLRYIRTKRLGWRTRPADAASVRIFEERYHVPTMVDRHGPEAAIRPPAGMLEECGRAELLEIIHEDRAVGMSLFRPTAPQAELLQIGVLDGDEKWLKMRILSLCYALPALQCALRDLEGYDLGRTPPFPWHPVLNFKSKWGAAVDPGPATDRLLVRLPAGNPATWRLLAGSGLVALRRDGRPVAIVAVDATSELARLREVALPGLAEIVVVHDGVAPEAIAAAFEGVRHPTPRRLMPRADLDRLAAIVG